MWDSIRYLSVKSVVRSELVGDAFDTEFRVLEVEQESGAEAGDVQVAEHLGDMGVGEVGDDFGVHDDGLLDDEVGDQRSDVLPFVEDIVGFLLLATNALLTEFDHEGAFIELFVEAWLEGVKDGHGGTDDDLREVGIHEPEF